jgi:hypothetical protein
MMVMKKLDYSLIDNIEFDGVDYKDHPDYCDAFIIYAEYDGKEMSDDELDELNNDSGFIYESLMSYLF